MEEKELSGLKQMHSQVRLTLLASLVLFLIGLFALVSRWDSAVAIIIFACIFRLGAVWWMRRRYNAAWTRSFVKAAAEKVINPADYQARERIPEMLVSDLGFAPEVRLVPNSLRFHVLRGELAGCSVTVSETAFVRITAAGRQGGKTAAGTLVTAENALPDDEKWILLFNHPLDGICPMSDYDHSTWQSIPAPVSLPGAACFTENGSTASLEAAAKNLAPFAKGQHIAMAAADGKLSILLPGSFYAAKPDIAKAPDAETLQSGTIPILETMEKILAGLKE
ncbi:MAG: hypothetical protein IKH81_04665 [Clostridia bacterium]|nr:hypothetical protein [Clostridia bacterium]